MAIKRGGGRMLNPFAIDADSAHDVPPPMRGMMPTATPVLYKYGFSK